MKRTLVALFDDVNIAQRALEDLLNNGFDRSEVSVVHTNQQSGSTATDADVVDTNTAAEGAAAGAGIGAVLGGMAGLLIGLGALAIPGIGPIIAAGPLAVALGGAGLGAAAGGLIGALTDAGIPEDEAGYYAEGIRRGGTLLTVRVDETRTTEATQILNRHSPVNIEHRASEWRSSGWSGFDTNLSTDATSYTGRFEDYDQDFRNDWQTSYGRSGMGYERYEPAYRYGWQARGLYRGRDWNAVESDLRSDWERSHPNDAWEDFKDAVRTGWERFKEGARDLGQDVNRGMDRMGDEMRDTGRDMDRTFDRTTSAMNRSFEDFDRDWRSNWGQNYRTRGYDYEHFLPAYQYGYNIGTGNNGFRGRQWNEIEADVRRDWETRHPGSAWEEFKDAIRYAWQRVQSGT